MGNYSSINRPIVKDTDIISDSVQNAVLNAYNVSESNPQKDGTSFDKKQIIQNLERLLSNSMQKRNATADTKTPNTIIPANRPTASNKTSTIKPDDSIDVVFETVKRQLMQEIAQVCFAKSNKSSKSNKSDAVQSTETKVEPKTSDPKPVKRITIDQTKLLQELLKIEKSSTERMAVELNEVREKTAVELNEIRQKAADDEKAYKINIGLLRNIITQKDADVSRIRAELDKARLDLLSMSNMSNEITDLRNENTKLRDSSNKWRGFYYEAIHSNLNPPTVNITDSTKLKPVYYIGSQVAESVNDYDNYGNNYIYNAQRNQADLIDLFQPQVRAQTQTLYNYDSQTQATNRSHGSYVSMYSPPSSSFSSYSLSYLD